MNSFFKPLALAILCVAFLSSASLNLEETLPADEKLFGLKSGRITYALSGVQTGTETVEWAEWGAKQYKYSKSKIDMMGVVQENESITINIGKDIYVLDPNTKKGTHIVDDTFGDMTGDEKQEFGEKMLVEMGGKKVGTETIAGLECDKWEVPQMFALIWEHEGLTLKSEVDMMGQKMKLEATKVEKGVFIPDSRFSIKGYSITEMGNTSGMPGFGQ